MTNELTYITNIFLYAIFACAATEGFKTGESTRKQVMPAVSIQPAPFDLVGVNSKEHKQFLESVGIRTDLPFATFVQLNGEIK